MRALFIIALTISLPGLILAGGIDFFHGTWEEAIAKAKEEGKVIFVDSYTTWCGPCKRMAKTVFTDNEVGEFYNQHFINLKLDMEKKEGIKFGGKYPVSAYPTLHFIDADGKVLQKVKGAQSVDGFLALGKSVYSKVDFSKEFAEAYEKGDRDPELILNYVKALNKSGKASGKVANAYLRSQDDLSTDFNINFIYEALAEADSRIFSIYTDHKKDILKQKTEGEYLSKIEEACQRTVKKAIEFDSPDLLAEAKSKMKSHHSGAVVAFNYRADMDFAAAKKDQKTFLKAAAGYAKKVGSKNPETFFDLCQDCLKFFPNDPAMLKQAIAYNEKANEMQARPEFGFHLAQLYYSNKEKDKAINTAKVALAGCDENSSLAGQIQRFIKQISAS